MSPGVSKDGTCAIASLRWPGLVRCSQSYSEWGAVFGDEVAAAAIIDRLLHYSTTVNICGESYRLKDKKRAGIFTMPTSMLATTAPQVGNLKPALRRNRS
jgi:hypothetical protein